MIQVISTNTSRFLSAFKLGSLHGPSTDSLLPNSSPISIYENNPACSELFLSFCHIQDTISRQVDFLTRIVHSLKGNYLSICLTMQEKSSIPQAELNHSSVFVLLSERTGSCSLRALIYCSPKPMIPL